MSSPSSDYIFLHEEFEEQQKLLSGFWDVLIVDDDTEIHAVTELALSNFELEGKGLRFHHAYDGEEAIKVLRNNPSISVVLLDVVMETDDAGLVVAKRIREELDNALVRIVLRTGQPGSAPEETVIREYDINDYRTKTELTRAKLAATLVTALRSYSQVTQLSLQSHLLSVILSASEAILSCTDIEPFCELVIERVGLFSEIHDSKGFIFGLSDDSSIVIHGDVNTGSNLAGKMLASDQLPSALSEQVITCFHSQSHQFSEHGVTLFCKAHQNHYAIHLLSHTQIDDHFLAFLDLFLSNVGMGLDNVLLVKTLREIAFKDGLTGLNSRNGCLAEVQKSINHPNPDDYLVLIDIKRFSDINEGLSQDVGNDVLKAVARRLEDTFVNASMLARLGADVFAMLVNSKKVPFESLQHFLTAPYQVGENLIYLNFSFGLCPSSLFGKAATNAIKRAAIALSMSKKAAGEKCATFDLSMEERAAWRLNMISQLRKDFADRKLEVWYQPQLQLDTGEVYGCEALLRWRNDNGEYISPSVFVPLCEDAGLIIEIGQWVLEQACETQKMLAKQGIDLRMAVNVSVPQFKVAGYVQSVKSALEKYEMDANRLELEVTESIVMDDVENLVDTLKQLKKLGLDIAIDDFGTGFSSLSYLQKLPFDRLKIDRDFIKGIPDSDSGEIAELVVSLAKRLNVKVLAEGVETPQQEAYLKSIGCDEVQGFFYAKPLNIKDLSQYLSKK
ncbi:EAL domain-containing protein [Pseudoalteromonas sp. SSDWG2]|uniref:bifunctional diguanylate cyclase/phosphodiesterase n=1 Tax=Pseudoalteromonas sp. SSDWG2 TaxID=3139391 RepID=UPI003BA8B864